MLARRSGSPRCGWSACCSSIRRFNAFFKHGEAQLFLALRDGRVVGRISAQIDHAFNDYQGNRWGMFGFLELEDDQEVVGRAARRPREGWLRERGRDRMVGPMDFTMNDESGVVIEGFEREPMIRQPWHPPYYRALCEGAGLEKAIDLLMWQLEIADRAKILPVIFELAERCEPEHGIRLRQDVAPLAAARPGPLRRDLQRGLVAGTGASCRTRRRTSTPTRRSCSSSSTRTGSWSPSAERRGDGRRRDHRARRQPGAAGG